MIEWSEWQTRVRIFLKHNVHNNWNDQNVWYDKQDGVRKTFLKYQMLTMIRMTNKGKNFNGTLLLFGGFVSVI